MNYAPLFGKARQVRGIPLVTSGNHTAYLLDDIESTGVIEYLFILAVYDDLRSRPCLYIASEVNANAEETGGGSHYLGLFPGDGHENHGSSDNWADIEKFEKAAIQLATQYLTVE